MPGVISLHREYTKALDIVASAGRGLAIFNNVAKMKLFK